MSILGVIPHDAHDVCLPGPMLDTPERSQLMLMMPGCEVFISVRCTGAVRADAHNAALCSSVSVKHLRRCRLMLEMRAYGAIRYVSSVPADAHNAGYASVQHLRALADDAHDAWLWGLISVRYTGAVAADAHGACLRAWFRSDIWERSQLMLIMLGFRALFRLHTWERFRPSGCEVFVSFRHTGAVRSDAHRAYVVRLGFS